MIIRYPSGDRNIIRISGPRYWISTRSDNSRLTLWSETAEKPPRPLDTTIYEAVAPNGPIAAVPAGEKLIEGMRRSQQLHIDLPGHPERIFFLPQMGAALDAQRHCNDNILSSWGVDPKLLANLRSPPRAIGNWSNLIEYSDYPILSALRRDSGEVTMRFQVGTDGRARNCVVLVSSGYAALDSTSCRLIEQRARFEPAVDQDGHAVPAIVSETVNWLG